MQGLTALAIVCTVLLPAAAGAMAPRPITVKAGYKETWAFSMQGKPVGTQEAACTGVRTVAGRTVLDWKYDLKLSLAVQGTPVSLSMRGTFSVTDQAAPVALTIDANLNGTVQKATYAVQGKTVTLNASAGGQQVQRSASLSGDEALIVNNLVTLMSLATRTRTIAPGQSVTIPVFSAEQLQKLDLTFSAQPKTQSVTVGGKAIECVVCDVPAIMATLYVDKATGALTKYVMKSQGLEIVRQ